MGWSTSEKKGVNINIEAIQWLGGREEVRGDEIGKLERKL